MVNELRSLLNETSDNPPYAAFDAAAVLRSGRSRVRRRRAAVIGATGLAATVVVGSTLALDGFRSPPDLASAGVPTPAGTVLRLADATPAVEGDDYRVLTTYTNEDLDSDNGQYLDGLTDDGLVLFRDAPDAQDRTNRLALMDPATGEKDWLPAPPESLEQIRPVDLGTDRLLWSTMHYEGDGGELRGDLRLLTFDRQSREWSTMSWPGLPRLEFPSAQLGPDGRLYVGVPATQGKPPPGGWPIQPGGDAEDADAQGDSHDLWSVSLTDPDDVRDEGVRFGDLAFTDESMVWTDRTNGDSGLVHVRDLATGEETEFDPQSGEKCNLLAFGATDDRIVLGQYCGTYEDGVRDDRVQVLSTTGEQVVTIQDSDIDGSLGSGGEPGLVRVRAFQRGSEGYYVYDLSDDSFVRVSESVSKWELGGAAPAGHVMWDTSANRGNGATQVLAEWQD
ncbi:hypothetical protein [Nocardioides allogilvus]|uniref:hypothetical protein n=1 Tax=Nocardioides allogilvus TaxID=2072017 RepID=UPI000D30C6D8|nr:hypothetical protein [Nocardioides allogilvus]